MTVILIVEDNAINMKLATLLVQRAGHSTLQAGDAESGLLLARVHLPDLILMDIQLPGIDGFAATAELKKDPVTADIPVIALTAMALSRDKDRARAVGCDAYITKPLRYQELQDAINWLMPWAEDDTQRGDAQRVPMLAPVPAACEPVQAHADNASHPPNRIPARAPGATRILIAEDNPTNQKLILWQLTLLGYAADVTENGARALVQWRAGDYDLVITDLHMPELNGYELAAAIRAAEPPGTRVPILAMTASAERDDADHARSVGMNDYLMRPLHLKKLRAALLKWLPGEAET